MNTHILGGNACIHRYYIILTRLSVVILIQQSYYVTLKSLQFKYVAGSLIRSEHVKTHLHQIVATKTLAIKVEC